MLPDILKVIIVKVDDDTMDFYIHLDSNVLSGYNTNLSITENRRTRKIIGRGTNVVRGVNIVEDDFNLSINYSFGVDSDGNDITVSNNVVKNNIDYLSIPVIGDLDLSEGLSYKYDGDSGDIRLEGLSRIHRTFTEHGLLAKIGDSRIDVIDSDVDYCVFDRDSSKCLIIFEQDSAVEELGIGLFQYDIGDIDDDEIIRDIDWLDGVSNDVNISGFETITIGEIKDIFDRIKSEKQFTLTRSESNNKRWVAKYARNNILDENNLAVVDTRGNRISVFTSDNYNYKDNSFTLDDVLDGQYVLVGDFVNYYRLLSRLWEIRVANRVKYVNTNVRGVNVRLEQEYNHCVKTRDYYNNLVVRRLSWD